jgi:hypothetical protein
MIGQDVVWYDIPGKAEEPQKKTKPLLAFLLTRGFPFPPFQSGRVVVGGGRVFIFFRVERKTTMGWMDGWMDGLDFGPLIMEGGREGWRVVFWDLRGIHINMCSFVPCGQHGRSCPAPSNGAGNDGKKTTGRKRLRR